MDYPNYDGCAAVVHQPVSFIVQIQPEDTTPHDSAEELPLGVYVAEDCQKWEWRHPSYLRLVFECKIFPSWHTAIIAKRNKTRLTNAPLNYNVSLEHENTTILLLNSTLTTGPIAAY
ncbi:hypothetical protein M514_02332 [Trichuris suis]|uniref:Uncharacterized protein n=1 Tax=Trichuris suis TaxID=68888 RepID=A0A085MHG0_9BILA|nr:hypothetical protein M513_02332 [Trichuris suis]KFD66834.1 hypothetical protein M514_02332 [Trichuris suis]